MRGWVDYRSMACRVFPAIRMWELEKDRWSRHAFEVLTLTL